MKDLLLAMVRKVFNHFANERELIDDLDPNTNPRKIHQFYEAQGMFFAATNYDTMVKGFVGLFKGRPVFVQTVNPWDAVFVNARREIMPGYNTTGGSVNLEYMYRYQIHYDKNLQYKDFFRIVPPDVVDNPEI